MLNLFNTIIEMNIKASVVILFILVVRLFLKNVPKKFSYLLWTVAAFRLCIPYSFKALFSLFNVGGKESIGEQISHSVEQIPTYTPAPIVNNTVNTIVTPPIHTPPVNTPPIHAPVTTPNIDVSQTSSSEIVNAVAEKSIDWGVLLMQIALILWIIGIAAMLIYGVITYVKTYRRMQSGILTRDNIYFSDKTDTPFSMGFIKPKIYLPFGLTAEEQECIIAHEECHIKRFDHIIKLFSYLLLCVHWFNPMCWIAFNRMTYDMETSCDEMVFASGITEEKKKQYSHTLVSVGTKKRFPTPAPINFDGISNTKSRIKNILKIRKTKIWIKIICYVLCAIVLFACAADVSENITDFQSEADNAQSDESTQSDADDKQNATTKPEGLIADALANKINIITEDGKSTLVKNYIRLSGDYYHKQAFVDMDGDGKQEAVLELSKGRGYVILREYNNTVYSYDFAPRALLNLKTDGTYQSAIGNGNDSICRMSFSSSQKVETIIANLKFFADLGKELYTINGEIVPANEYQAYYDEWLNKERVVFSETSKSITILQNGNGKEYTATVSFENDKAYLNISSIGGEYKLLINSYDKGSINKELVMPYAVDVTFGGYLDILVPVIETGSAIYYSAFVYDNKTDEFKYAPHFENFPNFILDTQNQRILAHRQGDMSNYYAYCKYNSDIEDFEITNSVFFECVDTENYTYEFTESKNEGGVLTDVAKFTLTGDGYYSVKGINAEIDETYYSEGSFWELDSPKWRGESVNDVPENTIPVSVKVPNQEALENGEYDIFIESEYAGLGDTMLFVASEKVTDFKVIEIEANDNFEPIVGETLYYQHKLTPDGKPLYVQTYINTFSERGIQYTDKNGYIRTFQIWYDAIDGDLRLSEFNSTNVNVSELVVNAINGNVKITTEDGERVYLTDIALNLPETKFTGYTFLDLDSDGTAEGILQLYNYYGYIILREYNNEVYSYFMNYRGFHLKNDSTCLSSSGASDNYIYRIEFDESTLREVVLAVCCETYESNEIVGTYEINGNAVSAEEAHTYFKQWYEKEDVSFTPFEQNSDTAPAEDIFEIGIATEEMLSDRNNIRFIDDYGENNTWHVYVKPNYNLTDFRFFVIDGTDTTVISRTMYAIDNFNTNDTFIASTYINDVTSNRGFGFIDQSGKQRFFAIVCDMSGLKESPVEALEITDSPLLSAAPYYDFESVALRFYNAYMQNDIETAKILMDSTDNECLEYFSNNVNEYNSIKRGRISLSSVINDNKGNITEAKLDIAFSDTREGYENTDYMVMTLKKIGGYWFVSYYDFDA
ncbi:MAG: hypothetical protein E7586_02840 [Ruminococcaceae bacterium]|nr:hypothetical protein [Oscillospiraceae bacterium]